MPAGSAFVAALAVCVQRGSRTMRFEFATATRIIFGAGALREVGLVAKEFGDRALVVTGKGVDRARPLLALLEASGISSASFSISGEPIIDLVVRGARFARSEKCRFVIGFGGGSAIDAGKAVAALMTNEGAGTSREGQPAQSAHAGNSRPR